MDRNSPEIDIAWRPAYEERAHAEVIGQTTIRPIAVGTPSPPTEPVPIHNSYRPLPFRPDTVVDGWTQGGVSVRGASLRGHLHRFNGAPREDDFAIHRLADGRVVLLVADGVSEAQQSHLGSAIAVRSAAEWLHKSLARETAATDWQLCFASVAWALNEHAQRLLNLSDPDPVATEQHFATTLVCAVVEEIALDALRVHVAAVGDSTAWLLSDGIFHDLLADGNSPLSPLTSSEVTALPRVPSNIFATVVDVYPGDVLLVGTDGFGDPLGGGEGGVGNLFRDVLNGRTVPSLVEFAHALDFSREAFDDDRTLVAAWPADKRGAIGGNR
ncbi:protein phosphatase 2C domain-containing protein [Mycolicibacterium iranicum]|uniref:protein phosphatase 2C domain-containing protein n=1 Tax=Mycolicibacterium iranicum TaxID=912594 RepID=UPI002889D341|nr:protein phosphatase 2C domain-containing protein [Mycolicibacterium iranicum]